MRGDVGVGQAEGFLIIVLVASGGATSPQMG